MQVVRCRRQRRLRRCDEKSVAVETEECHVLHARPTSDDLHEGTFTARVPQNTRLIHFLGNQNSCDEKSVAVETEECHVLHARAVGIDRAGGDHGHRRNIGVETDFDAAVVRNLRAGQAVVRAGGAAASTNDDTAAAYMIPFIMSVDFYDSYSMSYAS